MKNTNVSSKSNDLISALETHFEKKINLARLKFISSVIIALIKVRTVTFESLARAFDSESDQKKRRFYIISSYIFEKKISKDGK